MRRNKKDTETDTISMIGPVEIPELGDVSCDGETHPLVIEIYESIKKSAAVKYYEPTDWTYAKLALLALNEELVGWAVDKNGNRYKKTIGAMKLTAINQMLSALLLTEGDRRRVRLEVERASTAPTGGKVLDVTDVLKQRLAAANAAKGE
ncbi:hypothetical protein [Mycolicibacterium aichiense]|uniref:phage terminase small subunit n=1 Tax=Mycolicibacterium aichiense TaxID=1799 RepID=UPI001E4629EE|nr:hypothetical protein [Mycolicibacterium aichiense]